MYITNNIKIGDDEYLLANTYALYLGEFTTLNIRENSNMFRVHHNFLGVTNINIDIFKSHKLGIALSALIDSNKIVAITELLDKIVYDNHMSVDLSVRLKDAFNQIRDDSYKAGQISKEDEFNQIRDDSYKAGQISKEDELKSVWV